ncbi:MAG: GNAT family N-acetyltransferase [Propionibacteriaceae bacterium]|nr:GNAT family N-acetyltransferase [Propionibacteriaceae bacterium]
MTHAVLITHEYELQAIHRDLLQPNFPPHELISVEALVDLVATGSGYVLVLPGNESYAGVAVVTFHAAQTDLLSFLAVDGTGRSKGYGSALLAAVLHETARRGRSFLLAEIAMPGTLSQQAEYGDVQRRAAFYARAGAKALVVRHWLPYLGPKGEPVRLMLLAIPTRAQDDWHVPTNQLREFETSYHDGRSTPEVAATLSDLPGDGVVAVEDLRQAYHLSD